MEIEGSDLVVVPIGLMSMWAAHGRVRIPIADVVEAVVLDDRQRQRPAGTRTLGTHTPSICAGWFRTRQGRELWFVGDGKGALALRLREHAFARVVAQVEHPEDVIARYGLPTPPPGVRRVGRV